MAEENMGNGPVALLPGAARLEEVQEDLDRALRIIGEQAKKMALHGIFVSPLEEAAKAAQPPLSPQGEGSIPVTSKLPEPGSTEGAEGVANG